MLNKHCPFCFVIKVIRDGVELMEVTEFIAGPKRPNFMSCQ